MDSKAEHPPTALFQDYDFKSFPDVKRFLADQNAISVANIDDDDYETQLAQNFTCARNCQDGFNHGYTGVDPDTGRLLERCDGNSCYMLGVQTGKRLAEYEDTIRDAANQPVTLEQIRAGLAELGYTLELCLRSGTLRITGDGRTRGRIERWRRDVIATSLRRQGIKIRTETLKEIMTTIGYHARYDFMVEYFEGLPEWDNVRRIDDVFTHTFGLEEDDVRTAYARYFFGGAVQRVFEQGSDHFSLLALTGEVGGEGKTTFFKTLGGDGYVEVDELPSDSKTFIEKTAGAFITEFSELGGYSRRDQTTLKALISINVDRARLSYAHDAEDVQRNGVLAATTNEVSFLRDLGGARRWHIVDVTGHRLNDAWLTANTPQLWAEALHDYAAGVDHHLPPAMYPNQMHDAAKHAYVSPVAEVLAECLVDVDETTFVVANRTIEGQGIKARPADVADALKQAGFKSARINDQDGRKRSVWRRIV